MPSGLSLRRRRLKQAEDITVLLPHDEHLSHDIDSTDVFRVYPDLPRSQLPGPEPAQERQHFLNKVDARAYHDECAKFPTGVPKPFRLVRADPVVAREESPSAAADGQVRHTASKRATAASSVGEPANVHPRKRVVRFS